MQYTLLGRSGLRVSRFALGTMTFGESTWGINAAVAGQILDVFGEAGGNFLDTSNSYTEGRAEQIVGDFLRTQRDAFVVGTKYSMQMRRGDLNSAGNHRKNLVQSIEGSLRRLGTDYVDVLWVHARETWTPVEEVMRALDDQVRAGKILYVGASNWPAWEVAEANTLAGLRGWTPFVGLQLRYNLLERTPERELLPMAQAFGMAVVVWGPLPKGASPASTWLTAAKDACGRPSPTTSSSTANRGVTSWSNMWWISLRSSGARRHKWRWPGFVAGRGP